MSRAGTRSDSLGMFRKPFGWLIALGICCSLVGMARAWSDVAAAEAVVPTPRPSAHLEKPVAHSNAVPTVVTQVPPTEAVPQVLASAATPTPPAAQATPVAPAAPRQAANGEIASLPAATAAPATAIVQAPAKAAALLDLMNSARLNESVEALSRDSVLDEVALARAENLLNNGYFDHYAPDGESAFSELTVRGIRYRLAGENLARNNFIESRTVQAAYDGLMASPGHRANILEGRFARVGVAAVQSGHMWVYVTVFKD